MIVRTQVPQDLSQAEVPQTGASSILSSSISNEIADTSAKGLATEVHDCTENSTRETTRPKYLEPTEFQKLSAETGLVLIGAAGVNLDDAESVIFFSDTNRIADQNPIVIPLKRVVRIELLKDTLIQNTPLNLPSLWLVRLHLSRTETSQKARLDTVFEH